MLSSFFFSFPTRRSSDLDGISFSVGKGEVLGFLGPNGAGKLTTMRMITGFIPPSGGTVSIGDFDVAQNPIAAKRLFGYLRSEEHTSELQSLRHLVCRLLL